MYLPWNILLFDYLRKHTVNLFMCHILTIDYLRKDALNICSLHVILATFVVGYLSETCIYM